MFEFLNQVTNTIETLLEKPGALYTKYVPKFIRFILYPISQVGLLILILGASIVSFFLFLGQKIKQAYQNYE